MPRNIFQNKLESFYDREHRMPTYSEMMKLFGFKSKNAVYKLVQKLLTLGLVGKDHLGRLVPLDSWGQVPLLGAVTAGLPANVEEEWAETVDLDQFLINKKELTYMLEVDGDSMIDAHIEKGDLVLVEKTNQARDMDIVIANIDGEFTMKYLREYSKKRWLEPANRAYKPIYPEQNLEVVAKVKAVIRKL
jgi:SOS regulatory protein LexA